MFAVNCRNISVALTDLQQGEGRAHAYAIAWFRHSTIGNRSTLCHVIEDNFVTKPQRQLRFVQIACILLLGGCGYVAYFHGPQPRNLFGFGQGIVILLALWSAVSGFTMQRRFRRRRQTSSSKSTPFTQWRAGHIVRLWSAVSVGLWALLLYYIGGPLRIAYVLFALAMALLLIWRPDAAPIAEGPPQDC